MFRCRICAYGRSGIQRTLRQSPYVSEPRRCRQSALPTIALHIPGGQSAIVLLLFLSPNAHNRKGDENPKGYANSSLSQRPCRIWARVFEPRPKSGNYRRRLKSNLIVCCTAVTAFFEPPT